ncbi:uncharacterized protein METZ01_LOCUS306553, partial [marine metagenome]
LRGAYPGDGFRPQFPQGHRSDRDDHQDAGPIRGLRGQDSEADDQQDEPGPAQQGPFTEEAAHRFQQTRDACRRPGKQHVRHAQARVCRRRQGRFACQCFGSRPRRNPVSESNAGHRHLPSRRRAETQGSHSVPQEEGDARASREV